MPCERPAIGARTANPGGTIGALCPAQARASARRSAITGRAPRRSAPSARRNEPRSASVHAGAPSLDHDRAADTSSRLRSVRDVRQVDHHIEHAPATYGERRRARLSHLPGAQRRMRELTCRRCGEPRTVRACDGKFWCRRCTLALMKARRNLGRGAKRVSCRGAREHLAKFLDAHPSESISRLLDLFS